MHKTLVFLCICFAWTGYAADDKSPPISILTLKPGQSIHIDWKSQGCFHSERYLFDLEADSILRLKVIPQNPKKPDLKPCTFMLSPTDLANLEKTIQKFRKAKWNGSTTTKTFELTLLDNDKPLKVEKYTQINVEEDAFEFFVNTVKSTPSHH